MRKDICKQVKRKAEEAKVAIREHRRKANDTLKKQKADSEITEDEVEETVIEDNTADTQEEKSFENAGDSLTLGKTDEGPKLQFRRRLV